LQVLIQVNISHEENKSGVSPNEVLTLAADIANLPNLSLRGIMAIPLATKDHSQLSRMFAQMNDCFLQLKSQYPQVDTLSMGMSGDLDCAISEGSTMVRIGTAIFGTRN
jgi:pyridoxal phosphate enzyme (YggS family)